MQLRLSVLSGGGCLDQSYVVNSVSLQVLSQDSGDSGMRLNGNHLSSRNKFCCRDNGEQADIGTDV
jgi:hypothetical protein